MSAIRAYVVEPQALFVDYLVEVLRRCGIDVRSVTRDLRSETPEGDDPTLLFLDLEFESAFPEHVVRVARERFPHARIVVYAMGEPAPYLAGGADDVVSKELGVRAFMRALRKLARGRRP